MDELDKGLNISVRGDVAERALSEFREQAGRWGVALPTVVPLVLDFGLGDFARTGLIEYWIANEAQAVNLALAEPAKAAELAASLERQVTQGFSAPRLDERNATGKKQ